MKKHEIVVGGIYTARISGKHTTVRVEAIRENPAPRGKTSFEVYNLTTRRRTVFRSAARFRASVVYVV